MTDRELMQQALEALKEGLTRKQWLELITALRERLAQPEQPRRWVGLTEEEMVDLQDRCGISIHQSDFEAIEAKLREKNT